MPNDGKQRHRARTSSTRPRRAPTGATWPNFGRCGSVDALKAGPRAAEGHRVVDRYEIDKRLPLVRCPTLVITPTADPHAHPHAPSVATAIAGSTLVNIENGMVPLPDQMPKEFAEVVHDFLSSQPVWGG